MALEREIRPIRGGETVTPHDSNGYTLADDVPYARGLYLGTAGQVTVVTPEGGTITFANLAAGVVHPIASIRVNDTGTDALTDIVALW